MHSSHYKQVTGIENMHFVQRTEIIDGSECHPTCIKSLLSRNVFFICFLWVFLIKKKSLKI